jgi:iron complex outermembrane receptor protein
MLLKKYISFGLMMLLTISVFAQETKKDINSLSRKDVLEMTIEELSDYNLEEMMKIMDIVGASSIEELYELLLNKDVTSASKSEESLFDSPLSTTVLSHDQIITSGATCFEEALRLVPGVIVREKTNGNFDVHIRGNDNLPAKNMMLYSENTNTLVMINGRPVFNYAHGGTLWETLPVSFEDIDRIEVVRGPSSALYGPNAVTGVINLITQTITDDSPLFSGNFQGGTMNTYIGDIAFRNKINDKISIGITGNYEYRDREREEIYVYNGGDTEDEYSYELDGVSVGNGYYTTEEMRRLELVTDFGNYKMWPEVGETEYTIYDIDDCYPNPGNAKDKYAINSYVDYNINDNITFNLSGGYQNSNVITSSLGDMPTPYSARKSTSAYVDLRSKIKNLSFQANYNGGTNDFMLGNEGFELDQKQYSIQAEYNIKLDKIDIRPGVSYQSISYDDTEHITELGRGYLNGESTINISAANLRLDYKPTEKLRLVAALRAEKYNNPDDIYASWQFIGSYKINDNNLFRAVYSRANQSSFMVNTYSNYTWNIVNRPYPRVMQFDGNKDHDLKTMDMFEIGYRVRPSKSILIDFEAFYNISKDFGALMPDYTDVAIYNAYEVITAGADPIAIPDSVHMQYSNLDLKSKQLGASISIDWVINKKLIANAHLTLQQTKLDNYLAYSRDEIIEYLATDAATNGIYDIIDQLTSGEIGYDDIPSVVYSGSTTIPSDTKSNYKHKATPDYFGGFSLTYRPTKKLEIFPQAYFYGEQTFENQYGTTNIDSKILLNAKVSYKATNNLTFSINGRNILNQDSKEFAYMDKIPSMYLVGLNFNF